MSLHENFNASAHPGFTRSIDPRSARRQLHVTLGLASLLAVAIGGSAFVIRPVDGFDVQSQRASIASAAALNPHTMNADVRLHPMNGG